MPRRIAVVDMGSNTLKFSITEVDGSGSERVIHAHAETVRLGAGVAATGSIDPERFDHALSALRGYESIARSFDVEACIGVATAALRMASNGADLLDRIERTTGWSVNVISGEEEAQLAFDGLARSLPEGLDCLLVDIGGGSTELIKVVNRNLIASESIDIGSGTLADRCFTADPPGLPAVLDALRMAKEELSGSTVMPHAEAARVVLSGGNGQFLKAFMDWSAVAIPFTPQRFRDVLPVIASIESENLARHLDIAQERARMLPAGAAIALAVIERTRPLTIEAAPSGIRGSLVARWLANHP